MDMASTPAAEVTPAKPKAKDSSTSKQIRGSSLMLAGRMISLVANFAIQVLIIRFLSKAHYGAFAYALSFVAVGQALVTFGLDRAVTRFVPIYHEKHDYGRIFGTLALVFGTIVGLGLLLLGAVYGLQDVIGQTLLNSSKGDTSEVLALLLILIGLAPIQALDDMIAALFAIFASPRAIFFRKYLLAPGLKLTVVALLIILGSNELFLASGYLVAGALGTAVYGFAAVRMLQKQQLLAHFSLRSLNIPAKELLAFTIPMLSSDLVTVLMTSSNDMLLQYFQNSTEVAAFRAVVSSALLNQFVLQSFTVLFTPIAARLFARGDYAGINAMYWQTAIWTSVLSFPIFALTFSLARPWTILVFGEEYATSAAILALLSVGYYFNAATGFNGLTLKVYGRRKYIVGINLVAALTNVAVNLVLIPRYGALGAAYGTCGTLIFHNLLKQAGLRLGTGISLFEWKYLRVYVTLIAGALGLLAVQWLLPADYRLSQPYIYISLGMAALVSALVIGMNRKMLNVGQMFPELLKIPLARKLFT